jgi:alpha-methylacyl-CoA racemase
MTLVGGPLNGYRVVELGGIGPSPFAAMMLADMGADVVRIDRPAAAQGTLAKTAVLHRSRRSVALDLKQPADLDVLLALVERADALIEGFRPGVAERLGCGPDVCLARNPRLIYARMTGWGQDGPLGDASGHDINYIALAGALHAFGRVGDKPVPPLNLVGDFGGGGMLLAFGVVCGLLETSRSGQGQVVDAAMVDGSALQMAMTFGLLASGAWQDQRGVNLLDTGAPFYEVYETRDGKYVAVGALEPQFYGRLLELTGLDRAALPEQLDRAAWPVVKERFATLFKTKTRAEWCAVLEGSDACFAPVLSMREAPEHPHNVHRGTFSRAFDLLQPAPAPRFSRTPGAISRPPAQPGEHTFEACADWGVDTALLERARAHGAAPDAKSS